MSGLRDRRVLVLLGLVVAGSVLTVLLALDRPASGGNGRTPPGSTGTGSTGSTPFRPADLLGPGGTALDAAVAAVPAVFGYDHRDLDGSLARATATMTRRYATSYTRAFDRRVRAFAARRAAIAQGLVRGAGVVRTDSEAAATCLLYVDQVLVEARGLPSGGEPEVLSRNRLRVDLVRRDDTWLVTGIRAL